MIVTAARIFERRIDTPRTRHDNQRSHGIRRRIGRHVKPAVTIDGNQPAIEQPCQVRARSLRRSSRKRSKLAGRALAAIHQQTEHRGTHRVADQRADLGDVDIPYDMASVRFSYAMLTSRVPQTRISKHLTLRLTSISTRRPHPTRGTQSPHFTPPFVSSFPKCSFHASTTPPRRDFGRLGPHAALPSPK